MFNSVVSTVDFSQNIGLFLLKKEKVLLSLSVGLGVRKWSEAKNGDIVITEMVWEPYIKIRDALTVYSRIWQLGISILVAGSFLAAFLWSVKNGQFDDDYTPSVRMLFDDEPKADANLTQTKN